MIRGDGENPTSKRPKIVTVNLLSPPKWSDEAETRSLAHFWGGESKSIIIGVPKSRLVVTEKFHVELGWGGLTD
jgi:hypothetical protein